MTESYFTRNAANDRDVQMTLSMNNGADIYFYAMANYVVDNLFAYRPFEGVAQVHSKFLLKTNMLIGGLGYPGSPAKMDRDMFDADTACRFCMGALPAKFYEVPNWTNMLGCDNSQHGVSESMMEAVRESVETTEMLNVPKFVSLRYSQVDFSLFRQLNKPDQNYRLGFRNTTWEARIAATFEKLDKSFLCVPKDFANDAKGYFGPVPGLCRSFDHVSCYKGEWTWANKRVRSSAPKQCVLH